MSIQITGDGQINGIDTGGLNDSVITAAELATNAVTTDKINSGAVTAAKLSNSAAGTGVGFVYSAGTDYIIWQAPDGQKIGQCWGTVTSSATDFVAVSFPITFASSPSVVVVDQQKSAFSTISAYTFMLSAAAGTTSFSVQCVVHNSTGTGTAVARAGSWQAVGPV